MREHKYSFIAKIFNKYISIVVNIVLIYLLISNPSLIIFFPIIAIIEMALIVLYIQFPDIKVSDEFLFVKFIYGFKSVSWNDVINIEKDGPYTYIVTVKELTLFHKLIAISNGIHGQAAFLIDKEIEGFIKLITLIEGKIENKKQSY